MDDAARYILRQQIAAVLDYPSAYMGGPSPSSVRRAIEIIRMLEAEWVIADTSKQADAVARVKTWRTSPWDSLERT